MTDFAGGVALLVAAFFFGLRQIMLNPEADGWPPAPTMVRVSLFSLMVGCLYQGVSLTGLAFDTEPGRVSAAGAFFCWAIAIYATTMCVNVARQYYPKAVWDRVERILTLASCRNSRVLIELYQSGVKVFLPNRKDPTPLREDDFADPEHL